MQFHENEEEENHQACHFPPNFKIPFKFPACQPWQTKVYSACTYAHLNLKCTFVPTYLEIQCFTAFRATCDIYVYATCTTATGQKNPVLPLCCSVVHAAAA